MKIRWILGPLLQEKGSHHLKRDEKQQQFSQTSCLLRMLTHFMPNLSLFFFFSSLRFTLNLSAEREDLVEHILFKFRDVMWEYDRWTLVGANEIQLSCVPFHSFRQIEIRITAGFFQQTRSHERLMCLTNTIMSETTELSQGELSMQRHLTWTKRRKVCLMVIFSLSWCGVCAVCIVHVCFLCKRSRCLCKVCVFSLRVG